MPIHWCTKFGGLALAAAMAGAFLAPAAQATPYVVKLTQQVDHVTATSSGAFDLQGLTLYGGSGFFVDVDNGVVPSVGFIATGPDAYGPFDGYSGGHGLVASFGSGGLTNGTTGTGKTVAFSATYAGSFSMLYVPQGYVSGTALTSSATWDNASFATLGVTPGTYEWTWGSAADQSFTLDAVEAVPGPAALGMFGLGLVLVGSFVALRRRMA